MTNSITTDKEFLRKVIRISLPVALQSLMLALVAAADAFMLGRIDQNSMSAVSLASQIQFIQNMLVGGIVSATSVLGAQYWGKKDLNSLNFIFALALKLSVALSLLFFLACIFTPGFLMKIFTNEPELIVIGSDYLRIAGWSYLLTAISQIYLVIMKVSDHASLTAIISSCTVVLNIILNSIFIFGLFGIKAMEAKGAALATLISRIIELCWCIIVSYKKNYIHPQVKSFFQKKQMLFIDFTKCLLPLLGAFIMWGVGFTSYSAFMGHLGTDAAASNSVSAVIRDLVCCLCNGLATGAGIVIGNELGAGKLEKAKNYGDKLVIIAFICGIFSALLMLISTPFVMNFVKLTNEAQILLKQMMLIMSFYMIGRAINSILINGIFDGGGDTLFDFYSLGICMWGIAVPLAALGTFLFHWPVWIVYACTCLDEVGKIPWVMIHYKKYKWVKNLTR